MSAYLVTWMDGTSEQVEGSAAVADGVLTVIDRSGYGGDKAVVRYPLVNIRKWEKVNR